MLKILEKPSVIVMDNASYHSTLMDKPPTSAWTKPKIAEWLREHNIPFENSMLKSELLQIVIRNKLKKEYVADHMAEEYGHKVLCLPPYHCIFNPIELYGGWPKIITNRHIGRDGRTIDNYLDMWKEALSTVTPQIWMNSIRHTEEEIQR